MALTEIKVITGTLAKFNAAMSAAIAAGFQPVSDVEVTSSQVYSVAVAKGAATALTEVRMVNGTSRKDLFEAMQIASAAGYTLDTACTSIESGQCSAMVYKGSKGGGATAVAWADVTGKPTSFATTAANITDAGATGRSVLQAATGPLARTALGASALGSSLMIATDMAAAKTALGVGATGSALMNATTFAEGRTALSIVTGSTVAPGLLQLGTTATMAMAGDKTLATIGGVVPAAGLPAATTAAFGAVKKGVAVADAAEGTELAQLNALLASLRTAGVIS